MTFIDWFAGIGGFRRGMELAGHKCVGFCEFDKYAVMSYTSMHLITDSQREKLSIMNLKDRQKEIGKEEYKNGEWYANDIRRVYAPDIPRADVWCFGFPCQDISIAGLQKGFAGNRSSLFFRVMYLVEQLEEDRKPSYLFIENVKNLLSIHDGWDFARLLSKMDENGYDAEWQVLDSQNFGVPQHRERVFIIGHLRGRGGRKVFPIRGENTATLNQLVGGSQGYRVYGTDGLSVTLSSNGGGAGAKTGLYLVGYNRRGRVGKGCSQTLDCSGQMGTLMECGRIRRLTPRECFRLQGFPDEYYEKAAFVNSDSQLYKQAGNGVTVNVISEIAKRL